jgi:ribosomal protein S18 acetylase RimI-like enzyme
MTTPITLSIRDALPSDAATIVEFNRLLAWETEHKRLDPAVLTPGVETALREPKFARYFLCTDAAQSEAIVGQMMITYEWSDWRNGLFWWIQSVYVHQDARRRGVFRALYQHVEQLAKSTPGVIGLRLYVEHDNTAAIDTYRKLGMVPSGHLLYERDWSNAT